MPPKSQIPHRVGAHMCLVPCIHHAPHVRLASSQLPPICPHTPTRPHAAPAARPPVTPGTTPCPPLPPAAPGPAHCAEASQSASRVVESSTLATECTTRVAVPCSMHSNGVCCVASGVGRTTSQPSWLTCTAHAAILPTAPSRRRASGPDAFAAGGAAAAPVALVPQPVPAACCPEHRASE